ncbi:Type II secretion system (T2SS), protein F [uncultured archaeon]|nr:Type II secretion system (T2SS), protein F [uncultured archaeon]
MLAFIFFSLAFFAFIGQPIITIGFLQPIDYFVFGILGCIGPLGFYNSMKQKRKREIMDKLPDFLRDIANSSASGMTIYDSIRTASEGDYGRLTEELKMTAAQLSWGIPVDEVLTNLGERVNTNEVKRLAITIKKALEIGGNTSTVFNAAAKELDQIRRVEQQRRTEMSMYSIVIFISFFVFLAVILIINGTIFKALYDLQGPMAGKSIGNLKIATINPIDVKNMFFTFVFVQSLGGGLLGGFMMEGRISAGIRQAFILILISFITFKILI